MPRRAQAPIVGRKEMAAMLGVHPNNSHRNRLPDLPASLQEQFGAEVIAVSVTPLWFRDEIEAYADERERRAQNLTA
jgi:hypothetical protein